MRYVTSFSLERLLLGLDFAMMVCVYFVWMQGTVSHIIVVERVTAGSRSCNASMCVFCVCDVRSSTHSLSKKLLLGLVLEMLVCVCVMWIQGTVSHIISVKGVNARSGCHDAYDFVCVLHKTHNRFRKQRTIISEYNAQSFQNTTHDRPLLCLQRGC